VLQNTIKVWHTRKK